MAIPHDQYPKRIDLNQYKNGPINKGFQDLETPFEPRNDEPLTRIGSLMNKSTVSDEDIEDAGQAWTDDPPDSSFKNLPETEVKETENSE